MKQFSRGTIAVAVLILFTIQMQAARHTISGSVVDNASGETLIGATIFDKLSGKGTITNAYGYFSLPLNADSVNLYISFVGYETQIHCFRLKKDTTLNIKLNGNINLQAVVIKAEREHDLKGAQMSAVEIGSDDVKSTPTMFGEADVIKTVQLMPGVQSGSEGTTGMYVRGGGPDENLYLLDGIPIYNVDHAFGFFSAFNPDAIKDITLYKGSFPAHFGSRLSSVLDIYTNNGNDQSYHGSANIGLISAKINFEGPIVKEKTTFNVSARRTYLDIFTRPVIKYILESDIDAGYWFYDINAKITHKFSDRSRLFASYYMGNDVISIGFDEGQYANMDMDYVWGNIVGSLRWNYMINSKLFMNLTGAYTRYKNDVIFTFNTTAAQAENLEFQYRSGIQDLSARIDFDYVPADNHSVKFGGTYTYHIFTPDVIVVKTNEIDTNTTDDKTRAHEITVYGEDTWNISRWLRANLGLNYSVFNVDGKTYQSLQPRASLRFLANDNLSFKLGYAYMTQYVHLLSNSNISLPSDLWVPSTGKVAPMNSNQVAGGMFYKLENIAEFSAEGYFKYMNNLIEYRDGASYMFSEEKWDDLVALGDGWSYGIEFMAKRNIGKVTGWIAYTWSETERLFDREGQELNRGIAFPAKYDRRHDISIVVSYKPNRKIDFSATWVFSTGNAMTLGMQRYQGIEPDNLGILNSITYIESRNNYRMPNYHRMDVSVNFNRTLKHGERTLNISIYNVYNHKNPYMLYTSGNRLMQLSIFQIIPSVSYAYKF